MGDVVNIGDLGNDNADIVQIHANRACIYTIYTIQYTMYIVYRIGRVLLGETNLWNHTGN